MEIDKDTMLGSRLVTVVFIFAITLVPFFFGERLHFRPFRLHRLLRYDAALTDGHDRRYSADRYREEKRHHADRFRPGGAT